MAIFTQSVKGLDELVKATQKIAAEALPGMRIATYKAANVVKRNVKQRVPYNTGQLMHNIIVKKTRAKKGAFVALDYVTFDKSVSDYAVPLELGHRIMTRDGKKTGQAEPKPYLRPGAEASKDEVAEILIDAMNAELEKWGK